MGILDKMNIFGGKTPEQKDAELDAIIEAQKKANEEFVTPDDEVETPQISEEELAEIEARRKAENDKLREQIGKEDLRKTEYPDFE